MLARFAKIPKILRKEKDCYFFLLLFLRLNSMKSCVKKLTPPRAVLLNFSYISVNGETNQSKARLFL